MHTPSSPSSLWAETLTPLRALAAAVGGLPRIQALHLPPLPSGEAASREARGEFCALELAGGTLGLAYVLLGDTLPALHAGPWRQHLPGQDALALAERLPTSTDPVERVLAWAALNALTRWLLDRAGYQPPPSRDSLGQLPLAPGVRVGMVGLFGPLVARILASGAELDVVELRADLVQAQPGLRVSLDPAVLSGCRHILCTSTVLLNNTLEALLPHCRNAVDLALIGPGAGCLPDALFARGVTLLGGSWVVDAPACLAALTQGESLRGATQKVAMERSSYPGAAALLARAVG